MPLLSKTDLWKFAATMMGMSAAQNVLNADSPTTALESTFSVLYDQIRTSQILTGSFDFAMRTRKLRQAPTLDYTGSRQIWTESWDYVYAAPHDSLRFLRWRDSVPREVSAVPDFQELRLPIQYKRVALVPVLQTLVGSGVTNAWPGGVYIDGVYLSFLDDSLQLHEFTDVPIYGGTYSLVGLKHVASGFSWDSGIEYALTATPWEFDLAPFIASGKADLAAAPAAGGLVDIAYGSGLTTDATTGQAVHLATNVMPSDAVAVFLTDVTTVSQMPVEFQISLAAELAYRASIVHSKAPRMIQALEREMMRTMSKAVTSLTSDDGHIEGGGPSRATQARW